MSNSLSEIMKIADTGFGQSNQELESMATGDGRILKMVAKAASSVFLDVVASLERGYNQPIMGGDPTLIPVDIQPSTKWAEKAAKANSELYELTEDTTLKLGIFEIPMAEIYKTLVNPLTYVGGPVGWMSKGSKLMRVGKGALAGGLINAADSTLSVYGNSEMTDAEKGGTILFSTVAGMVLPVGFGVAETSGKKILGIAGKKLTKEIKIPENAIVDRINANEEQLKNFAEKWGFLNDSKLDIPESLFLKEVHNIKMNPNHPSFKYYNLENADFRLVDDVKASILLDINKPLQEKERAYQKFARDLFSKKNYTSIDGDVIGIGGIEQLSHISLGKEFYKAYAMIDSTLENSITYKSTPPLGVEEYLKEVVHKLTPIKLDSKLYLADTTIKKYSGKYSDYQKLYDMKLREINEIPATHATTSLLPGSVDRNLTTNEALAIHHRHGLSDPSGMDHDLNINIADWLENVNIKDSLPYDMTQLHKRLGINTSSIERAAKNADNLLNKIDNISLEQLKNGMNQIYNDIAYLPENAIIPNNVYKALNEAVIRFDHMKSYGKGTKTISDFDDALPDFGAVLGWLMEHYKGAGLVIPAIAAFNINKDIDDFYDEIFSSERKTGGQNTLTTHINDNITAYTSVPALSNSIDYGTLSYHLKKMEWHENNRRIKD